MAALHDAWLRQDHDRPSSGSLRSMFRFGQREGWVKVNPAKPLRNPRKDRALPHFMSTADVARLLAAPPSSDPLGLRDRAIFETLYSAGLRVSELAGLNDGDLDFDSGCARVRGKGKRERIAPLGSHALRALQAWLAKRRLSGKEKNGTAAPVFVNKFGRRLTTRSVARMLEKYLRETGLDARATPHTLRHSFCHASARQRRRYPGSVQELLGHKSLVTTQIYTHMTTATLKAAYEKAHPRAKAS